MLKLLALLGLAAAAFALRGDNLESPATSLDAEKKETSAFDVLAADDPEPAPDANAAAATAFNLGAIPPLPAGPRPLPHPRLPGPLPFGPAHFRGPHHPFFRRGRPFLCPRPPPDPSLKEKDLSCRPMRTPHGCTFDYNCIKFEEPPVVCPIAPEKPRRSQNCNWIAILDKDNCIVDYECEPKAPEECRNEPIRPDDTPLCKFTAIKSGSGCVQKYECEPNLPLLLRLGAARLPLGFRQPILPIRQFGPVLPAAGLPIGGFRPLFPAPLPAPIASASLTAAPPNCVECDCPGCPLPISAFKFSVPAGQGKPSLPPTPATLPPPQPQPTFAFPAPAAVGSSFAAANSQLSAASAANSFQAIQEAQAAANAAFAAQVAEIRGKAEEAGALVDDSAATAPQVTAAATTADLNPIPALASFGAFSFKAADEASDTAAVKKADGRRFAGPVRVADANPLCCFWVATIPNECEKNEAYMKVNCQRSCGTPGCTPSRVQAGLCGKSQPFVADCPYDAEIVNTGIRKAVVHKN